MSDFEFFYNVNGADDETFALIGNKAKRKEKRAARQAKREQRRGGSSSSQQAMSQQPRNMPMGNPTPTKMGERPNYVVGKNAMDLLPPEYIAALQSNNLKQTLNKAKIDELSNELEALTEKDLSNNDFVTQAKAIIDKYVTVVTPAPEPEDVTTKSLTPDSGNRGDWWDSLDNSKKVGLLVGGVAVIIGIAYVSSKLQS